MKKGKKSIIFSLIAISLLIVSTGFAQEGLISKVKTIEKIFDQSNIDYFGVTNVFGDIEISYWNQEKIRMIVTIKVIAWEEEDAERFIGKLMPEIDITENKDGMTSVFSTIDIFFITK